MARGRTALVEGSIVNPAEEIDPLEIEEFIEDAELESELDQMELYVDDNLSDLIPREQQTRRGRRVSKELMVEVRAMLEQLTDSGRLKVAAVALSYGSGMTELTSIWLMERIRGLRLEQGWTDPDFLRAMQDRPKDGDGS
jgi:hypothetical protein